MSEAQSHIEKTGDGEICATFSQAQVSHEADESKEGMLGEDMRPSLIAATPSSVMDVLETGAKGIDPNNLVTDVDDNCEETAPDNSLSIDAFGFGDPTSASTPMVQKTVAENHDDGGLLMPDAPTSGALTPTSEAVTPTSGGLTPNAPTSGALTPDTCIDEETEEYANDESEASSGCDYDDDKLELINNGISDAAQAQHRESLMIPGSIRVPIIGHETMEARSKFTVFKIHVMVEEDDLGWFIFRRYSDFVNLNDQLKSLFPNFRLTLPPKRWFRSNFDADFLEERKQGLQAFLDNVTGHRDLCNSQPVHDFFCFDDPPGPHDSLEESRAQCECLEEMIYLLRKELSEKEADIELLKEEMTLYKNQVQLLTTRLSELNKLNSQEKAASEKRRISTGGGRYDIDNLFGSGEILLGKRLESLNNIKEDDIKATDEQPFHTEK